MEIQLGIEIELGSSGCGAAPPFYFFVNITDCKQVCTSRSRDYLRKQNSSAQ